jgi:surfeit locus 1 family protein
LPLTLQCGRFRWSASWPMTLLTLIAVVLFIGLGRWQWHRADAKRALAAQFQAGTGQLIDASGRTTATLPRYSRVRIEGRYDGAHQFLLDNMSHDGDPGYEVLTPLTLPDGRAILVNRGWVPLTQSRREPPQIGIPTGLETSATVVGLLDNLPVAALSMGHVAPGPGPVWPKLTSFPTMADLAAALGLPLETRQLLLDPAQPAGYVRDWHPSGFGPTQHLSYAIQWWFFAALALGLYAVLNRRRHSAV